MGINGVKVLEHKINSDSRGTFKKIFESSQVGTLQLQEAFVTESIAGVVRGMHLQLTPESGLKLVTLLTGNVFDVLIDLRKDSSTYKQTQSFEINAHSPFTLLIPEGVAHGFQALTKSVMLYQTEYKHSPAFDTGVHPLSFGIDWPLEVTEISERDQRLPNLMDW